jgi:hypothetical protein
MNLHLPSAITITALVSCLHMCGSPSIEPRPREPQGREWVQNGMRGPPTGSANLAMGKSPVERGIARAHLQHSRERSLLPTIPSRGHRRADVRAHAITPKRLWRFLGSPSAVTDGAAVGPEARPLPWWSEEQIPAIKRLIPKIKKLSLTRI